MASESKESNKGMKWKAVLAVLLVLAIIGVFLASDYGKSLLGSYGGGLGDLTGGLTGIFQPKVNASGFSITLTASQDNFYGQDFKVSNTNVSVDGTYNFMTIGDQSYGYKGGNQIAVLIKDFSGDVQITSGGSITLSGTTDYVEIGDIISSSSKPLNVKMEFVPTSASVDGLSLKTIHFNSITGSLTRTTTSGSTDSVTLSSTKLDVSDFVGSLSWAKDGVTLSGTATSAKGDSFSLS